MRRLFYIAAGAAVGIAAMRRVSRAAHKLSPSGLADSAGGAISGIGESVRAFVDDLRAGMAQREIELHDALTGELPPPSSPRDRAAGTHGRGRSSSSARDGRSGA